jgi:uncharacterized protein (TIGR00297 family)
LIDLSTFWSWLSTDFTHLSTGLSPLSMQTLPQLILGVILGALIGYLAWRVGALSPSGGWAAAITGGLIFGLGGIPWAVLLLAFFISSSGLSHVFKRQKAILDEKFSKGSRRDWGQVAANGGLGALLAILYGLFPDQNWLWAAFGGAMAAVNADTWATELGVLSPHAPRLITTGKPVERGTSGGVTPLGYLAVFLGSGLIAVSAAFFQPGENKLALVGIVLLAGAAGSTFDSLLGATLQAIYFCPSCQKETERFPQHACGTPTSLRRGWSRLNNDWVNFLCSVAGAGTASLLWAFFL